MKTKFLRYLLVCWITVHSAVCQENIRIPFSSVELIEKVVGRHAESDPFEKMRQSGSIETLAVRDPALFENPVGLVHAALVLCEWGQWITALEFCQTGARDPKLRSDDLRELEARIYASQGEMARAHNILTVLPNQPEGAASIFWIGAYIQFSERIQRSLYEMRIQNKTLLFPDALIAGDRRILNGAVDGAFWQERFSLCRSLNLDEDAALAAAWIAWHGLENRMEAVEFLDNRRKEATRAFPALRSLVQEGKTEEAADQILFILQRAPVFHSVLKSLYDLSLQSGNKALAVSILGMLWQAGDDRIDMSSALPLVLQQGDFALLLSMASQHSANPQAGWEASYYLALAARAWNLPHLEARAIRALADSGFKGGIYSLPGVARLLFEEKPVSLLAHEQRKLATINPLADALAWRIRQLKAKGDTETIFPKKQLASLAEAAPADLLHVAFLLDLIDKETYESECSLKMEQEIASGILSFLDLSGEPDYRAIFSQENANGILKSLLHCRLVLKKKLIPPAILSNDPVFWTHAGPTENQIQRIRSGGTLLAEFSGDLESSGFWPGESGLPVRISQEPRFRPVLVYHDTNLQGPTIMAAIAKVREEALVERFLAADIGNTPKEQHGKIVRLTYSIANPPDFTKAEKTADMINQQITTLANAVNKLEINNRQLEATMLANEYLFSGVFAYNDKKNPGIFLRRISGQTREAIKTYAQSVVSRYLNNDRDTDETEELIRATAQSLFPPDNPYYPKAIAMVREGRSVSAIYQEIHRLKAEEALRQKEAVEARRRSEQRMREYWAEQDARRNNANYPMTAQQAWSLACQSYIQQSSRQPEVIKNYNANGTITIVTRY